MLIKLKRMDIVRIKKSDSVTPYLTPSHLTLGLMVYLLYLLIMSFTGDGGTDNLESCKNFDLTNIVMPVDTRVLKDLLYKSGYDKIESQYLLNGFENGFSLVYQGPTNCKDYSHNIPLRDIGTPKDLWDKMMKEVKLKRFAGPFKHVPFEHFVQSPVGLVPKAGGQTRLIFHL